MSDRDLDAEFARIIAGWDDEAPDPQLRRPSTDDVLPEADAPGDPAGSVGPAESGSPAADSEPRGPGGTDRPTAQGAAVTETSAAAGPSASSALPAPSGQLDLPIAPTTAHVWRGSTAGGDAGEEADGGVDDDEHFIPPSEIDLPSAENDPMFWAIVVGLAGGPLLLLYLLFFDRDGSGWWVVTGVAMVVVGFVLLVLRGGTERDPFDDGTRI
ncbi:hypothetical protein [Terrabacter sp. NPDC080008]|uniref:hypothetical protein n=1 Tax=Terrabacter sp. NPDC080008 TaxID=3155176 RepID=UPI00344ED50C